ncbi:MAG: hypothetical protein M3Z04_21420 [Chloroflexota bacterium]|nr:hypothetical protein [Chloroflexota bacterium]
MTRRPLLGILALLLLSLAALLGCDAAPANTPVGTPTPQPARITPANVGQLTLLRSIDACQGRDQAWSADSRIMVTYAHTTVEVWDVPNNTLLRTLRIVPPPAAPDTFIPNIASVALAPDGQTVAVGPDTVVRRWRVTDGTPLPPLGGDEHTTFFDVRFAPDGQTLVAIGETGVGVHRWRMPDGTPLPILSGNIEEVALTPDSQLLAGLEPTGAIVLWQLPSGTLQRTLQGPDKPALSLVFAPDGKTLATAGVDGRVWLWHVADGTLARTLSGSTSEITNLSFSADGQLLAVSGYDNAVRLWRVADGTLLRTFSDDQVVSYDVSFTPNGRLLAICKGTGGMGLWGVR